MEFVDLRRGDSTFQIRKQWVTNDSQDLEDGREKGRKGERWIFPPSPLLPYPPALEECLC